MCIGEVVNAIVAVVVVVAAAAAAGDKKVTHNLVFPIAWFRVILQFECTTSPAS
jgi:hypothetical protein